MRGEAVPLVPELPPQKIILQSLLQIENGFRCLID